jgi:hypothetical protein
MVKPMFFKGLNTFNVNSRFYRVTKLGNSKHLTPRATWFNPFHVTDKLHLPET